MIAAQQLGHFYDPEIEDLVEQILNEFDDAKRLAMRPNCTNWKRSRVMIWVVHDLNPRALSPKLSGFVQARNWFPGSDPDHGGAMIYYIIRRCSTRRIAFGVACVLFPGLIGARRSAADGAAVDASAETIALVKAAYGFEQTVADSVPEMVGPRADRRFRRVDRHAPPVIWK